MTIAVEVSRDPCADYDVVIRRLSDQVCVRVPLGLVEAMGDELREELNRRFGAVPAA